MSKANITKKLRFHREKKGYSLRKMGEILGKAKSSVATWESGRSQPSVGTFFDFCDVFEIDDNFNRIWVIFSSQRIWLMNLNLTLRL